MSDWRTIYCSFYFSRDNLIDWVIDWLIDWLIGLSVDRLLACLLAWLIVTLFGAFIIGPSMFWRCSSLLFLALVTYQTLYMFLLFPALHFYLMVRFSNSGHFFAMYVCFFGSAFTNIVYDDMWFQFGFLCTFQQSVPEKSRSNSALNVIRLGVHLGVFGAFLSALVIGSSVIMGSWTFLRGVYGFA